MEGISVLLVGIGIVIGLFICLLTLPWLLRGSKTPSTTSAAIKSLGIEVGDTVLFTTESVINDDNARCLITDYCNGDDDYYSPSDGFIMRTPIIFLDSDHTPNISAIMDDEFHTFIGEVVVISEHSFILKNREDSYVHIEYTDKCAGYRLP